MGKNNYDLSEINETRMPAHIAIIMDGNGRWAQKRKLPRLAGHKAGVEALRGIIRCSSDIGVKYLTVYAFSTENWKRPLDEIKGLFSLLMIYLDKEIKEINENNVKLNILGSRKGLPEKVLKKIDAAVEMTKNNTGLNFNIALNYGGREEVLIAAKKIYNLTLNNEISGEDDIDDELFSSLLYTKDMPDPDLLIRTSGEIRLSNFLLWQLAYSEFIFLETLWPDFKSRDLIEAISLYQRRDRRYGGIK